MASQLHQQPHNGAYHNNHDPEIKEEDDDEKESVEPETKEVDITINNVVSSFNVRCHLNLREIALNGFNVEYRKEHGMVTMKLRHPYTTASIWSSGKITCTGANSNENARIASRRFARVLQKLGFNTRFRNYRVVNVLGTCIMPFAIKITQFSQAYRDRARYLKKTTKLSCACDFQFFSFQL
jgi:transcription initiation factor TFIID TATA-box-binding protein